MMTKIAAIDYSMNSPSLCIGEEPIFSKCSFFVQNLKIKKEKIENISFLKIEKYFSEVERFHNLSSLFGRLFNGK